jgi:tetratricopeptide (TPR) repeat protein
VDRSAALRPLDEAADSTRDLIEYSSPAELNAAVVAVAAALDRSVRLMLREDADAPEEHRLGALSIKAMSTEQVVRSLRSRNQISLETAGALHHVTGAAERAASGAATARDADLLRHAVERVRAELNAADPAAERPRAEAGPGPGAAPAAGPQGPAEGPAEGPAGGGARLPARVQGRGRWMAWAGAVIALFFLAGLAWVLVGGGDADFDAGVAAFRAERWDSAAAAFERVLDERPVDVTARLYLARVYRRQGRLAEAGQVLGEAVRVAPEDAAVRREMGHLLLQTGEPVTAVAEYERALELDPESALGWAGLVRALRAAGDPRAHQALERAPPEARALLDRPGR